MAIVTRYFSTAPAGAGNGTTWADRAQLVSGGTWSTVITGFTFSGSDSLLCLIGPGTHTTTAQLASGSFASAPTVANPLFFYGCDSSGVILSPPSPGWTADQPVTWDTTIPVIATTTNIITISLANCHIRMVKFTSSGATSSSTLGVVGSLDWVSVLNSTSNTNATGISALALRMSNISVVMTGTSYAVGAIFNGQVVYNIRVEGNASASSGVRQGIQLGGTTVYKAAIRACVFNHVGGGIADTSVNAGTTFLVAESVAANCGASGILGTSTASQTTNCIIRNCMITGNGAYGINPQSSNDVISQNRLRNNTSGNFNTFGNFPSTDVCDVSNIYGSQAAADAAEYVDTTTGDFRIKSGSPIWGYGYGVSDQPSSGSVANVSFAFLG